MEVLNGADETVDSYNYDDQHNRATSTSQSGLASATYEIGAHNRVVTDGTYNYEYDEEGSRTARVNIATEARDEYQWDYRNRLVKLTFKDAEGEVTGYIKYFYGSGKERKRCQSGKGVRNEWHLNFCKSLR